AGLLRPSELASGHIDHALVMTIPCTSANGANVGYSWPATGGWGEFCGQYWNESATGAPGIGQLFKLNMTDAQIAASGAPTWEQTIMTALAHYGAYAEDTEGSWHNEGMYILTQDPISFTSIGQPNAWTNTINALGGRNNTLNSAVPIPTNKLEIIDPCVVEHTCPGAHGPGGPMAVAARVHTLNRHARSRRAAARKHAVTKHRATTKHHASGKRHPRAKPAARARR
ncbi:MAG TPA: hypothetical protein VHX62_10875, partial [Solirubrobacteraceae bacterium]|nr:hypothetical protein [Solirubrobacteraceae bacterium]